jgi:hypothetical protein
MIGVSKNLTGGIDCLRADFCSPASSGVLIDELRSYAITVKMKFDASRLNMELGQRLGLDTYQYKRF